MSARKRAERKTHYTASCGDAQSLLHGKKAEDRRDGWGFTTLECERGILSALELAPENGTFLLDSVTALLANEMFHPDGSVDWTAGDRLANDLVRFSQLARSVVFVADFVFSDGRDYGALTEDYRSALGHIGVKLAQACGNVAELSASIPIWYKGGWQP